MKRTIAVLSVLCILCSSDVLTKSKEQENFTIVFSHSIQGQLYPCGCNPDSLYGGVAKRAKIIKDFKASNHTLIVDAGDMLFKMSQLDQSDKDRWAIDADLILHSYSLMGCDALNVGEKDLGYGLSFLLAKQDLYDLPFTSACIQQNGEFVFKQYIVKEISGLKVGFFGLTQLTEAQVSGYNLTSLDPINATQDAISQLKAYGCDIIVTLSDLEKGTLKKVLERYHQEIDYAVSGHFINRLEPNQYASGNTVILKSGELGQEMGFLEIMKNGINSFNYYSRKIDDDLPDDIEVESLLDRARDDALAWEEDNALALSTDYATHLACIVCHQTQYKEWKTTRHAMAYSTLVEENEHNNRKCIPCHALGFKLPGGFVSPSKVGNAANVQCENCHGLAKWHVWQQGKTSTKDKVVFMWRQNEHYDQDLKDKVQWEAKEYGDTLRFIDTRLIRKEVPEEICLTCHMGEHTKPFEYAERLKLGDCIPD